ncbi:MAG: hypothetical protein J3T61_07750 [Candidatus Brocadiales bacterium]|nr:hypothetical protein [Candidatus Bathyanammoxibius sp.]
MKSLFSLIITSLFLLSSPARAAVDPTTIQLYHAALQKMERPFKSDDFRPAELDSAEDYDDLTQIYIEAGDYTKALETTMKALEIDQFDPIANLNAGLINYELEDFEMAAYYLRWALIIVKKAQKEREVQMGEDLLSTQEPAAYPAIEALLKKADEKTAEEYLQKQKEAHLATLAASMADRGSLLDRSKAIFATKAPEKEEVRPAEVEKPAQPPRKKTDIDAFYKALGGIGMMPFVSSVSADEGNSNKVIVTTNEKWNKLSYNERLDRADRIWSKWQGIKRRGGSKHGLYRIQLMDSTGRTVGASNWLNTKVWVKKG